MWIQDGAERKMLRQHFSSSATLLIQPQSREKRISSHKSKTEDQAAMGKDTCKKDELHWAGGGGGGLRNQPVNQGKQDTSAVATCDTSSPHVTKAPHFLNLSQKHEERSKQNPVLT